MRIATWNLAGRWDARHLALLEGLDADVLLLTEVSHRLGLPGHHLARTPEDMAERRSWAAIASRRPIDEVRHPHPATLAATIDGVRLACSILPWRGCTPRPFWVGERLVDKQVHAAGAVEADAPQVWGGDWNQAFVGPETAGTIAGRQWLLGALDRLGLTLPTAGLPHRIDGAASIDHVAVPTTWEVTEALRVDAAHEGRRLSDHDAYVVTAAPGPASRPLA